MIQYTFNKDAKKKKADVYIYDVIGDTWDGTTARQFAQDLAALGEMDELTIFINSPGGVVTDGLAIYNTLVRNKAYKTIYVDGQAGSIASVVAMAGDKIITMKNASWMIHNPYMFTVGGAEELRRAANRLDSLRETIIAAYTDRANGKSTDKQFGKWMDEETWFSAAEALEAGLTDEVSTQEIAAAACAIIAKHDFSKFPFKKVPESLLAIQTAARAQSGKPADGSSIEGLKNSPAAVRRKARVLQIASAQRTA